VSELIRLKRVDIFSLRLGQVDGFYSEWSPAVSTSNIKILPKGSESEVVIPENCKIEPPRLGEVSEFSLSITQRNPINPKQDLQGVDINKIFEDEEDFLGDVAVKKPDTNSQILTQLMQNEIALSKLSTPLWFIFILLLILSLNLYF